MTTQSDGLALEETTRKSSWEDGDVKVRSELNPSAPILSVISDRVLGLSLLGVDTGNGGHAEG